MASLSQNQPHTSLSSTGPIIRPKSSNYPLNSIMRDPSAGDITAMLQNASSYAAPGNMNPMPPLDAYPTFDGWGLIISIDGVDFEYQFTREDLQKVFQRYGRLTGVDTLAPEFPFGRVWFRARMDAEAAIKDLDGKVLNGIHGRLRVNWDPYSAQKMHDLGNSSPSTVAHEGFPQSPPSVRKYTCRFDIGIENDKEFQVGMLHIRYYEFQS